jgi:Peptidase family M28/PA domain
LKRYYLFIQLIIAALAISQSLTLAQQKNTKPVGEFGNFEAITAAQLKDYLYFIASDEMEGRETPSRGLNLTAKFLALNLSRWNLTPLGSDKTFLQKFHLYRKQLLPDQTRAYLNDRTFKLGEDYIVQPEGGSASGGLVYVGHGMVIKRKNINPYLGIDVKGKIMVVADAYPSGVTDSDLKGTIGKDFDYPANYARAHGAQGMIIVPNASTLHFWDQRHQSLLSMSPPIPDSPRTGGVPAIIASAMMVNAIFAGEKLDYETIRKEMEEGVFSQPFELSAGKRAEFNVGIKSEKIVTQNVVALLEGSDPVLKNEYVALGAHYDHVGNSMVGGCLPVGDDSICNGADDDGSGTVALLAIAEALSHGARPKRSVLFVWHAGEEKDLWGSDYFTNNPPVPLNRIITQLNIDIIGRSRKEGDTNPQNRHLTGPKEIFVIGSKLMSTELGDLNERVNNSLLKLKFNYMHDAPGDPERLFYRSDHYKYALKGIPIIFYFDGIHEDYHRPTDHPDKIDYQKMEMVTRTIYATMWVLANVPNRPKVDRVINGTYSEN